MLRRHESKEARPAASPPRHRNGGAASAAPTFPVPVAQMATGGDMLEAIHAAIIVALFFGTILALVGPTNIMDAMVWPLMPSQSTPMSPPVAGALSRAWQWRPAWPLW